MNTNPPWIFRFYDCTTIALNNNIKKWSLFLTSFIFNQLPSLKLSNLYCISYLSISFHSHCIILLLDHLTVLGSSCSSMCIHYIVRYYLETITSMPLWLQYAYWVTTTNYISQYFYPQKQWFSKIGSHLALIFYYLHMARQTIILFIN